MLAVSVAYEIRDAGEVALDLPESEGGLDDRDARQAAIPCEPAPEVSNWFGSPWFQRC